MDNKTLTDTVAARMQSNRTEVAEMIAALSEVITETCGQLDSIAIPGFGSFEGKKRMERVAVHPSTGKRMLIPPKVQLSFRPSALLKQKLKKD